MTLFNNHSTEILILLFLIVTFLQSGVDKVTDWNGNVSFIRDHFKNSPFKNSVPLLLGTVLVIEIIASLLMIIGVYQLAVSDESLIALIGLEMSAITLILLLIGQRLAKDYPGAMSLTVYFILTVFGVFLLQ